MKALYQVSPGDNVATALDDLPPGPAKVLGAANGEVRLTGPIPMGHKAATSPIRQGQPVFKYGAPIALAARDIQAGEYAHIHNLISPSDRRTGQFHRQTGQPEDMRYLRLGDRP